VKISNLPWGVLYRAEHARATYRRWFEFAARDPHIDAIDLIDGPGSLCGAPERKAESRALKPLLADLDLPVMMFVTHVDFRVAEIAPEEKERIRFLIEQAVHFEAMYFRTVTGLRRPGELFREDVLENVVAGLRWLAGLVRDAGLPFLIENHHETTDEMVLLCEKLADLGARLNCEIKPAFRYGMDPYAFVERLTPWAGTYHIDNFKYDPDSTHWDKDRAGRKLERAVPLDRGEIDIRRVLKIVEASGFDGWLSIEYGGLVDSFDDVARSAKFVRETWDQL